jgi:hypothetical protein
MPEALAGPIFFGLWGLTLTADPKSQRGVDFPADSSMLVV